MSFLNYQLRKLKRGFEDVLALAIQSARRLDNPRHCIMNDDLQPAPLASPSHRKRRLVVLLAVAVGLVGLAGLWQRFSFSLPVGIGPAGRDGYDMPGVSPRG